MTEMRTCGRCGDEYESYTVFVSDNFSDLVDYTAIRDKWGNVCEDCRKEIYESDKPIRLMEDTV